MEYFNRGLFKLCSNWNYSIFMLKLTFWCNLLIAHRLTHPFKKGTCPRSADCIRLNGTELYSVNLLQRKAIINLYNHCL